MEHLSVNRGVPALLLPWYDKHRRTLPWREQPTPYRVWVSEIMLQQTRVNAVIPYFERFMKTFPDVHALAESDETELLKLWEGLGYYSRARNLQKAAREIVVRFGGTLPDSYEALRSLPGIGEYTAGAIASIAFGIPIAAVDGNVLRVFSRVCRCFSDITKPAVKRAFQSACTSVLPKERPGDFNQAVMELGATVCLPNGAPLCDRCPLQLICEANQKGGIDKLPTKTAQKKRTVQKRTVLVILADGKVLLHKRAKSGLLAGLYEYVNLEGTLTEEDLPAALQEMGLTMQKLHRARTAHHIFTHREWHMQGYLISATLSIPPKGMLWASQQELDSVYPIPNAFQAFKEWPLE